MTLFDYLKINASELTLYFVTKKKITKLHGEFFEDPTPTDCISFPIDDEHLGEIFICPAVAIEYASKKNLDPKRETTLYLIHGLLHLIGYDDLEPKTKKAMRAKEKRCMGHLDRVKIQLKCYH